MHKSTIKFGLTALAAFSGADVPARLRISNIQHGTPNDEVSYLDIEYWIFIIGYSIAPGLGAFEFLLGTGEGVDRLWGLTGTIRLAMI